MKPARIVAWVVLIWLAVVFLRLCKMIPVPWPLVLAPVGALAVFCAAVSVGAVVAWTYFALRARWKERRDRRSQRWTRRGLDNGLLSFVERQVNGHGSPRRPPR